MTCNDFILSLVICSLPLVSNLLIRFYLRIWVPQRETCWFHEGSNCLTGSKQLIIGLSTLVLVAGVLLLSKAFLDDIYAPFNKSHNLTP